MDDLPPFFRQALADPSPVASPGQPLGTNEARNGCAPDFRELRQAFPIVIGGPVFLIPSPAVPTYCAPEIDIAKPGFSEFPCQGTPLEVVEPARGKTPDIYNGLDLILSEQGHELIQGSRARADAIDPLANHCLPRSLTAASACLPEKLQLLPHTVPTAPLPDPSPER